MAYWLVKEEPDKYPFEEFRTEKRTPWTGVRNYQARKQRAAVGTAEVLRTAYPDPTAAGGDWSCVDFRAGKALKRPVPLKQIKADPELANCALVRQGRLSVIPLSEAEFQRLLELGCAAGPTR